MSSDHALLNIRCISLITFCFFNLNLNQNNKDILNNKLLTIDNEDIPIIHYYIYLLF